ncbi:MAG: hypothetical protein U9R17_11195 [Thermodesulfobacteriota bacterium]|nr:hypothetical protein [Thermodesulfobacteriota bacterium]
MLSQSSEHKEELFRQIADLSDEKVKEILDFTYFIKAKDSIDPSQSYFWTKKWQDMEREADSDKKAGNIIGDGTLSSLLKELNE